MRKTIFRTPTRVAIPLILLACGTPPSFAGPPEVAIQPLTDHVVVMNLPAVGVINSVVVSSEKGLVLVDPGPIPIVATMFKAAAEKHFGRRDWAYVIGTHAHGHSRGSVAFERVPFIGHDNLIGNLQDAEQRMASREGRARLAAFPRKKIDELTSTAEGTDTEDREAQLAFWQAAEQEILQGVELALPSVTLSQDLTLHLGDRTVKVSWVGNGHSTADAVVYVPEDRVLVCGGACGRSLPRLSERSRLSDVERWISVVDTLLSGGVEHLVPGHASPEGPAAVERTRDYYRDLLSALRDAHRRGLSPEAAQKTVGLDERFPSMLGIKPFKGTREEAHAANVAAVWKLLSEG